MSWGLPSLRAMIKKNRIAAFVAAIVTVAALSACDPAALSGSSEPDNVVGDWSSFTKAQQEAVSSASDYLSTAAFSKAGLIRQLHSSAGEGYPAAVATFAVNHLKVDWNEQAYRSAKSYLSMQHFSLTGLTQQLESTAGEGFTHAQATYGAKKAYRKS